jgi:hypothetical protein
MLKGMSLVVAVHNGRQIVVAFDSLSTSTKTGAKAVDDTIQKVRQINAGLAFAVTGRFASDKLPFFTSYVAAASGETQLDAALDRLFNMAVASMGIRRTEGFRMSLIGFNSGVPGFRCVDVEEGKGFTALSEPGRNYWVSGEYDPVEYALRIIEQSNFSAMSPTTELEKTLRGIVADCIERYPQTLGMPVNTLVLGKEAE